MNAFLAAGLLFFGAIAPYTERGITDFDTVLQMVNPYGKWKEDSPGQWLYYPLKVGYQPFANGRWVYSDFGWYWQGDEPWSCFTDHYGQWILSGNGAWAWRPGPDWQAAMVDWRMTETHIGWRPSKRNLIGELQESEARRLERPEEWIFLAKEKFGEEIAPSMLVTGVAAADLLKRSQPVQHLFIGYREIERGGPDPELFPKTQAPEIKELETAKVPVTSAKTQVRYYTIMSLPDYWSATPPEAMPDRIYVFRPKFHQDRDGVQRRVQVWMKPSSKTELLKQVQGTISGDEEVAPAVKNTDEIKKK